jgi:FkbM family methyltransferase
MQSENLDLRELSRAPEGSAPWYFRLGRYLSKHNIRGGDRIVIEERRHGLLDRLAAYQLENEVTLRVPLWRPCNSWDEEDVLGYEAQLVTTLSKAIGSLAGDVTLIDCGADIGILTAHLVSRCRNIRSVFAFEPNPAAYKVLEQNLGSLGFSAYPLRYAVSDFDGAGHLAVSDEDPSAHAMYLSEDPRGPIRVMKIDSLNIRPHEPCVIKIDVEGSEHEVVRGARQTIQGASDVIVAFEAHPRVVRRTKRDPIEVIRTLLATGRGFTFATDVEPCITLSPDRPFFTQLPPSRVYNVIARSR